MCARGGTQVGDLYQLPAVEKGGREQQVFQSMLWSLFRFFELTELVRIDPDEVAFGQLLSRVRTAWTGAAPDGSSHAAFFEQDVELLRTRLCSEHCPPADRVHFRDVQRVRAANGSRASEVEVPQDLCHCPVGPLGSVLAARCAKVDQINRAYLEQRTGGAPDAAAAGAPPRYCARRRRMVSAAEYAAAAAGEHDIHRCHAVDYIVGDGQHREITCAATRARIDALLSGYPRTVLLHVGQRVMLTNNKRLQHEDFANGTLCIVVAIKLSERTGAVGQVMVRPVEWAADSTEAPIKVDLVASKPCKVRTPHTRALALILTTAPALAAGLIRPQLSSPNPLTTPPALAAGLTRPELSSPNPPNPNHRA